MSSSPALGSKITLTESSFSNLTKVRFSTQNGTSSNISTASTGTIIANETHLLLANKQIMMKSRIKSLLLFDTTARIFHPTQGGHALIANLIISRMVANNARSHGLNDFAPEVMANVGGNWPQIGGAACNTGSSDTWSTRDAMDTTIKSFCANPHHLKGTKGLLTSGTFNSNSLDYMNISISWDEDAGINEHSCAAWLDVVTDGCDAPGSSGDNPDNWKHGGRIVYQSNVVNATLNIEPLAVRRIWDKGQAGGQQCTGTDTNSYVAQAVIQSSIDDFCTALRHSRAALQKSGSAFSQTYNDGTPDRVVLTTDWPTGPRNFQVFEEECQYYMSVLDNGCSLPGDTNPMNWKHGGSISDNNGVKYTIKPTQKMPTPPSSPKGSCKAEYNVLHYSWDVWGGGFVGGNTAKNLETQIKGCGAVTAWKFNYYDTPDVEGVEWHASGTLPITISNHCLAKAVKSACGFISNC